jgi:Ni,Fe-hydrogenase III large subunit
MTSLLVHQVPLDALPRKDVSAWRKDVLHRLEGGARLLTLFGRPEGDRVLITSVFRVSTGNIEVTRTSTTVDVGFHELTSSLPALHAFEREVHEQTGVRIAGHPWLKPIRYEGRTQADMASYPFYRIEGKEVHEVAVGPIHAGVIEPGSFRFMCLGEQVHHLEIHLGYQHRGVERRLLQGDPTHLAPVIETIAGDTSIAHTWAYCAALESLAGCDLGLELELARGIALELERVAMHLSTLSGMAADIGFLQGATTYGRLRTTAINMMMRLCGSRFGRGALRPGGVGMRLWPDLQPEIDADLELLERDVALINDCFLGANTVRHRLQGVGTLTRAEALALGVVGTTARASGVLIDVRHPLSEGAYQVVPIAPVVFDGGDCWCRARVRIAEIDVSLKWLKSALTSSGTWNCGRQRLDHLAAHRFVVAVAEGFRGEVVHCLETDELGKLAHYKVQDPSFRNWMGLQLAVRRNEISDFPICNKSFDLSYCGNDL